MALTAKKSSAPSRRALTVDFILSLVAGRCRWTAGKMADWHCCIVAELAPNFDEMATQKPVEWVSSLIIRFEEQVSRPAVLLSCTTSHHLGSNQPQMFTSFIRCVWIRLPVRRRMLVYWLQLTRLLLLSRWPYLPFIITYWCFIFPESLIHCQPDFPLLCSCPIELDRKHHMPVKWWSKTRSVLS